MPIETTQMRVDNLERVIRDAVDLLCVHTSHTNEYHMKITAVRLLHAVTGWPLQEAKRWVDSHWTVPNHGPDGRSTETRSLTSRVGVLENKVAYLNNLESRISSVISRVDQLFYKVDEIRSDMEMVNEGEVEPIPAWAYPGEEPEHVMQEPIPSADEDEDLQAFYNLAIPEAAPCDAGCDCGVCRARRTP